MEPLDPKAELMRLADEWARMRVGEPFRHLAQTDAAVKFAVEQEARYRDALSAAITATFASMHRSALEAEQIAELIAAARQAQESLSHHWFSSDGEEEYNNESVIEADKRLQAALAAIDVTLPRSKDGAA